MTFCDRRPSEPPPPPKSYKAQNSPVHIGLMWRYCGILVWTLGLSPLCSGFANFVYTLLTLIIIQNTNILTDTASVLLSLLPKKTTEKNINSTVMFHISIVLKN